MKKTLIFNLKNGETFEAIFKKDSLPAMVSATLYKVRPNPKWWQFKRYEVVHQYLFAEDFNYNFHRMGLNLLAEYFDKRNHEASLKNMWGN
jgi:hypothetical protein